MSFSSYVTAHTAVNTCATLSKFYGDVLKELLRVPTLKNENCIAEVCCELFRVTVALRSGNQHEQVTTDEVNIIVLQSRYPEGVFVFTSATALDQMKIIETTMKKVVQGFANNFQKLAAQDVVDWAQIVMKKMNEAYRVIMEEDRKMFPKSAVPFNTATSKSQD